MSAPLLAAAGLSAGIAGRVFCTALALSVQPGERWAIVGPNGAGKTTLLRTLAGLVAPLAGSVSVNGSALSTLPARARALQVALLPQDSIDPFPASALDTVLLACHPHLTWLEWESRADVARARAALAAFGVGDLAARDVRTLSGGERRRVALAALVAQRTPLLLLDEPSSHLDLGQQSAALEVVAGLALREQRAAVMVLHDLHLAARYCDRVIALGAGEAAVGTAAEMLTAARLSALFGRPLVELRTGSLRTFVPE